MTKVISVLTVLVSLLSIVQILRAQEDGAEVEECVIPEGTVFELKLRTPVSSGRSQKGDRVSTVLTSPVYVYDSLLLPEGIRVDGYIEELKPAKRKSKGGVISVKFDTIELFDGRRTPILGSLTEIHWAEHQRDFRLGIEGDLKGTGPSPLVQAVVVVGAAASTGGIAGVGVGVAGGIGALVGAVLLPYGHEAALEAGALVGMRLARDAVLRLPSCT